MDNNSEIIVVDDTAESLRLLAEMLTSEGYRVRPTQEPELGLESALANPPDLILLDVKMPGMDGFTVCRKLKQDERTAKVPIIFVSGLEDMHNRVQGFEAGGVDFITKPIQREEVLARVHVHLELMEARVGLEKRVFERTAELVEANKALTAEIDKQLETEGILRKSEEKYRRLVENLRKEFFYSHDPLGNYQYLSPSIADILGYSQDEFLTHYTEHLTDNPVNEKAISHTELTCKGVEQPTYEIEIYHKNRSPHLLEVNEVPVFNDQGQVIAVEGIARDVTHQRKLETQLRQAQKMEAIGTLAGGIAHDFNNLLSAILGYSEMISDDLPYGSKLRLQIQEVLNAGDRAKDLVKQILTFSRHSAPELKPLNIQDIIKEALKLLRSSIPTTIEIRQDIDPDCGTVLADSTQIHQVIMNLGTNAYHAMRETGGILCVSLGSIVLTGDVNNKINLRPGSYVRIEISDTGHGITKDVLERIFEPYYSTKAQGEGTGLGLAMVHGMVTSLQGDITVYSEPGQGTTFRIYLPVIGVEGETIKADTPETVPTGSGRILLVDDEPQIVRLHTQTLERLGYDVTPYASSVSALEAFKAFPESFDLVITDMTMPDMTGAELSREIMAIRSDISIILCTGFSDQINAEKAKAIGIRGYVMKPFGKSEIAKKIRELLD